MAQETNLQNMEMYVNDYGLGWTVEKDKSPQDIPVMLYDFDHLMSWRERASNGGFGDMTIRTIGTVNGDYVPVRWLANLAETALLVQGLQERDIPAPKDWKMMAPIHINTICNNGNITEARNNASQLEAVAQAYIQKFHPTVPVPTLEPDNPDVISSYLTTAERLYPQMPDSVRTQLDTMAGKHNYDDEVPADRTAAYLLAHYAAYGQISGGLFPKRQNTLYVLPQSEGRFLDMMDDMKPAITALLGNDTAHIQTFQDQRSVVTMSQAIRTPHYYPHAGESRIVGLEHPKQWPTRNQLSHTEDLNAYARDEISASLAVIEKAVGGQQNIPQLITTLQQPLGR